MKTIGIPRAFIYWKRPSFWETFFENLGFQVALSPVTNKEIVEKGVRVADPETCFSNKVFWGHLLWLEGKADWLFVPRLKTNNRKLEYCPKFFGTPDLAKILVKTPILTETFDFRKESFEKTLSRLGKRLNRDKKNVEKAKAAAFLKEEELKAKEREGFFKKIESKKQKLVLISHPYILYDDYVNVGLKARIEKLGVEALFIDEIPLGLRADTNENLLAIRFHWEFGEEIMQRVQEILKYVLLPKHGISGAIELSSFQCGCDAVLKEFVEKEFKTRKIPFLYLIVDEHTADAGVQTRLEAFIDTL